MDFHDSRDGPCFPSYETISACGQCCRYTMYAAIKALEAADILTWVNAVIRVQYRECGPFGGMELRSRLARTGNANVGSVRADRCAGAQTGGLLGQIF